MRLCKDEEKKPLFISIYFYIQYKKLILKIKKPKIIHNSNIEITEEHF